MTSRTSTSSRNQIFAKAYDLGFSDGFRAACDECWALGFDAGLKQAAIEAQ
jgi:hypothetical protein